MAPQSEGLRSAALLTRFFRVLIGGSFLGFLGAQAQAVPAPDDSQGPVLFYRQPAKEWVEAVPIGNGRLGGMVFWGCPPSASS